MHEEFLINLPNSGYDDFLVLKVGLFTYTLNFEKELKEKTERLNALNIVLNLDKKDPAMLDDEPEQNDKQIENKSINRER